MRRRSPSRYKAACPASASSVCEYDVVAVPSGRARPVTWIGCGPDPTVRLKVPGADTPFASVICTVKLNVPAFVGVPLNSPELDTASPAGAFADEKV